uniref:Uncharacterized protein n=1 Tax=Chromera velia CCMP2878 TaxID=1169474 RepID=A0A0G4G9W6_9ALVE|eukprot:Cvel_20934.t1-p1 / transcript=Cvel_20934.t1 / gene=Cvel_20934 / organism=Chromera_velia_CCMP2878 / gene_product=hypothetical protein / transcript_product=hypothetical protein / location=Cvel_scaffold1922:18994-20816(-) / protein_length=340 / sequence_SO=supercontig / SO=protein_coding / is_pseudo=false
MEEQSSREDKDNSRATSRAGIADVPRRFLSVAQTEMEKPAETQRRLPLSTGLLGQSSGPRVGAHEYGNAASKPPPSHGKHPRRLSNMRPSPLVMTGTKNTSRGHTRHNFLTGGTRESSRAQTEHGGVRPLPPPENLNSPPPQSHAVPKEGMLKGKTRRMPLLSQDCAIGASPFALPALEEKKRRKKGEEAKERCGQFTPSRDLLARLRGMRRLVHRQLPRSRRQLKALRERDPLVDHWWQAVPEPGDLKELRRIRKRARAMAARREAYSHSAQLHRPSCAAPRHFFHLRAVPSPVRPLFEPPLLRMPLVRPPPLSGFPEPLHAPPLSLAPSHSLSLCLRQ